MSEDITICYIIGGDDHHYQNMFDSMKSAKVCGFSGKFFILEFGSKLKSTNEYQVENKPAFDKSLKKTGYLYWMQKYDLVQYITTTYGVYLDSDTLMFNNNLAALCEQSGEYIGIAQHWWVPTFGTFRRKCITNSQALSVATSIYEKYQLTDNSPFFAAGAFVFKVNDTNKQTFSQIFEEYSKVYENGNYVSGITDELFLGAVLNKNGYKILGGAFNHCFMGEQCSNLKYENELFLGKNNYEHSWELVTILHCDRARRDPTSSYVGIMKTKLMNKINSLLA